jgi:NAD(P)-dependent dehydrogenase (short-subunit alcohol dehydrogenase family)
MSSELRTRFVDRQVLIVGATGALGRAMAFALHEQGARLVLLGRRLKALERLDDELRDRGADPALYPLNLEGATAQDYHELQERLGEQPGGLGGLVWAAGQLGELLPLEDYDLSDWLKLIHVNLHAPAFLLSVLAPLLRASAGFALLPVNDPTLCSGAYWGAYGTAQAGLRNLLSSFAAECERSGPQVLVTQLPPLRSNLRLKAFPAEAPEVPVEAATLVPRLLAALAAGTHGAITLKD